MNTLFNQFNNSSQTNDFKDPENVVKYKCYNPEEVQTMKIPNPKKVLSLYSIFHIEDLEYLLKKTNTNFDITAISETRLLKIPKL